jgi:hypothetical protein
MIIIALTAFAEMLAPRVFAATFPLQATINAEYSFYSQGELVKIIGNVTDSTHVPVQSATVALEVHDSNDNTIFLDIVTSTANGSVYAIFRIPVEAPTGYYTIYSHCSKNGYYPCTNQSTFMVGSAGGVAFAVWAQKVSYKRFENATVNGRILYNQTGVPNATITFNIYYPNQTLWMSTSNITSESGITKRDFYLPPTIPAGRYTINGSSYCEGHPNATSTAIFEILNEMPTIINVVVNPQVIEKPGQTTIRVNVTDHEDYLNLTVISMISMANGTVQVFNLSFVDAIFELQYQVPMNYPSGTFSISIRAIDKDAGSADYETTFQVTTPVIKGAVAGFILNAQGQGVFNASVILSLKTAYLVYQASANVAGYYSFQEVLPGDYSLLVQAEGYSSETKDATVTGNQNTNQNVTLLRLPTLTGFITTEIGSPISNASVTVVRASEKVGEGCTDSNGSYNIVLQSAGTVRVTASATQFSPNSTTVTCALEQVIQVNLSLIKNGILTGQILDALDSTQVANATATLYGAFLIESRQADLSGYFAYDSVPPGNYTLIVTGQNYLPNQTLVCIYSNQTTTLQVSLMPTGNITGTVEDAGTGSPMQGTRIWLLDDEGVTVAAVSTGQPGTFLFYLIPPGNYTLKAYAYGYSSAESSVNLYAHNVITANFSLVPCVIFLKAESSANQFSQGETATFTISTRNALGQSIADNITEITVTLKGPKGETRVLNATRQGDLFKASYHLLSNETKGRWTVTVYAKDVFENEAEAMASIDVKEAFLIDFSTDKPCYVPGENIDFTAYIRRFSNLTQFLNSSNIWATVDVRDPQNFSFLLFNLTITGCAFTGMLNASGLGKGIYAAYITVADINGNTGTSSLKFSIVQDFQITVQTNKSLYNRTEPVAISGSLAFTNGTVIADTDVFISLTVKNCPRLFRVTTNPSGQFVFEFMPFGVVAGNYSLVSYTTIEGVTRKTTVNFAILGLTLEQPNPVVSMSENTAHELTVRISNTGDITLTNVTVDISPTSMGGVTISIIEFPQIILATRAYTTMTLHINAATGAAAHATFDIVVTSDEGAVEASLLEVYVYPAYPAIDVAPQLIDLSMTTTQYATQTVSIVNVGYGTSYDVTITPASLQWVTISNTSVGDIAPQDSRTFDVMICPLNSTTIGLYQDQIALHSTNHATIYIYIIVKITTAQNGSLVFRIIDDVGNELSNARLTLQSQEYWLEAYTRLSNATGHCDFPSIYGGRYAYMVSAENHHTVSGTVTVQPGSTLRLEVKCPTQLLDVRFTVTPTTLEEKGQVMLRMTFETEVPPPLLIPVPMALQYRLNRAIVYRDGCDTTMYFTLVNTGLISISKISLNVEDAFPSGYNLSIGDSWHAMPIEEIKAGQSARIPCRVVISPQTNITALSKGLVNKIKIEGSYVYFDNYSTPQTMKVTAEVAIQVVDIGNRMLLVQPSFIYQVKFKDHIQIEFAEEASSAEELPAITVTNLADSERVYLLSKVVGGGVTVGVDFGNPEILSKGLFLAIGHVYKEGESTSDILSIGNLASINLTAIQDKLNSFLVAVLCNYFAANPWKSLEVGESAYIHAKTWDIPLNLDEIVEEISQIRETVEGEIQQTIMEHTFGTSIEYGDPMNLEQWIDSMSCTLASLQAGAIVFVYQWELDNSPSYGAIPISILDVRLGDILDLIPVITDPGFRLTLGYSDDCDVQPPKQEPPLPPIPRLSLPGYSPPKYIYKIEYENVTTVHEIVKLSISQEVSLERDAFSATLEMTNRMSATQIDHVRVDLCITSNDSTDMRDRFVVKIGELQGILAIDGTGITQPSSTATVCWLIIPKPDSGGISPEGIDYLVHAEIYYFANWISFNVSSTIQTIRVKPQPLLRLAYYLPREVKANVPFKLGLKVTNVGYGVARNFKIESAMPVIYENISGLRINFQLTGTYVRGISSSNSLKINFGDIPPGASVVGYWTMVTSLAGNFTQFNATYVHDNALGGEETSLVDGSVETHLLVRDIMLDANNLGLLADGNGDTVPDELVNPTVGSSEPVAHVNCTLVSQNQATVTVRINKESGWVYFALDDPFNNQRLVKKIVRSDGKTLDEQNYWMENNKIHIVDDPEENYAITFDAHPKIVVLSPQNKTYYSNAIPLTFTISEPTTWIGSSLDDQTNVTINGNTIINVADGPHKIAIYANGTSGGNLYSEAIYFTVKSSQYLPWQSSFIGLAGYPVVAFAIHDKKLYASSNNNLYVYDGSSWNIINAPTYMISLASYNDRLVIGGQGGLYVCDGATFTQVFQVPTYIKVLGEYNNILYAGTFLDKLPTLYYCNGPAENLANWHIDTIFSAILNFSGPFGSIDSFAEYNGILYLTSGNTAYSFDGTDWTVLKTLDDVYSFSCMKVYNDRLYLATRDQGWRKPLYQGGTGFSGRVIEFDGENWTIVLDHDYWVYSLGVYGGKLYAGTANKILTYDGSNWETLFNTTEGAYYAICFENYDGKIYVGMGNGYIFVDPISEIATAAELQPSATVPEFSSTTLALLLMILSLSAIILAKKRFRRRFGTVS